MKAASLFTQLLVTGSAVAWCGQASAQSSSQANADDEEISALTEVILVTAQRFEQDIQDVPVSVTAIGGDTLRNRAIDSFEQLQFVAPGFSFVAGVNARQSSTTIRGIGTSAFASGIEGSVAIVIDGVVIGREGAGILDFNDLERVEVLRGPQGTLFGKNASAGVISFVTKNPTEDFSASFNASYGSFDEVNLSAAVSGPISDGVTARLSAYHNRRDGFVENRNPDAPANSANNRKEFGVRAKLAFDIGASELLLSADYSRRDQRTGALTMLRPSSGEPNTGFFGTGIPLLPNILADFGITPGPTNTALASEGPFSADSRVYGGSITFTAPIGSHDFVSLTSYRGWDLIDSNDVDQVPLPLLRINTGDTRQRQVSQEFRISSSTNGRLRYQGGFFFFRQTIDDIAEQTGTFGTSTLAEIISAGSGEFLTPEQALAQAVIGLPPPAAVPLGAQFGTSFTSAMRETNFALFGQIEFDLTERLSAFAGARLLRSEISGSADVQIAPGAIALGFGSIAVTPTPLRTKVEDTALVWRLGASYEFADDASIFATFTRGYKSAGLDNNQAAQETASSAGDFFSVASEIPNQFELGVRSRWLEGRVTANLTAFHTIIEDFQAQTLIPTDTGVPLFTFANAGKVRTYGFEAELTVVPTEGLSISGALAYTKARFKEFPRAACYTLQPVGPDACIDADGDGVGDFQDLAGGELNLSPDLIANGQIRYDFQVRGGFAPFAQVGVQGRSNTFSIADNDPGTLINAYALVDFQIGATLFDGQATLSFFGRNLNGADFPSAIIATPFDDGGYSRFPVFEAERTFGVQLSLKL